jgi:hypothetical protein
LNSFDFKIEYTKGELNGNPYFLTREFLQGNDYPSGYNPKSLRLCNEQSNIQNPLDYAPNFFQTKAP